MQFWIDHPVGDSPVGFRRWLCFKFGRWLEDRGHRMMMDALNPNCDVCGEPKRKGDHRSCDEIPF